MTKGKTIFVTIRAALLQKLLCCELKSSKNVNFPNEKRLPQSVYLDFMSHVHFQIALQSVCGVNGAFCSEDFEQIKPPNNICVLEAHFGVRERDVLNGREKRINISLQTSARGAFAVNSIPSKCALNAERTLFYSAQLKAIFTISIPAGDEKSAEENKAATHSRFLCTRLHIISNSINLEVVVNRTVGNWMKKSEWK